MRSNLIIVVLLFCVCFTTRAQTGQAPASSQEKPVWITMMEDPNVNYFEAVKAYEDYMKLYDVHLDEVEEELMGGDQEAKDEYEREMKRENKEIINDQQRKELVEREMLSYHIKRFKNWKKEVRPYVQENGHILSQEERTAIWLRQQEEMKNSSGKK